MPLTGFRQIAQANLPTRWASFKLLAFEVLRNDRTSKREQLETAVALVLGDLHASPPPVVRIHSQCTTGDAFESLRCDCHDQLHLAIVEQGLTILKNLNHRGAVGWDPKLSDGAGLMIQLPDRFLLYTGDGERAKAAVLAAGHRPLSALVRRASLEDVFLRLTGRSQHEAARESALRESAV